MAKKTKSWFCWPRIIEHQYSETNVIHLLFNLLRIQGLYIFLALFAHPQETLNKRQLLYRMRVMSVQYTKCRFEAPREDEQVMLEICKGPSFIMNWIISTSHWFHCTDKKVSLYVINYRVINKTRSGLSAPHILDLRIKLMSAVVA
jgi:hypothetical protein